jgi:hypothetical protein
MCKHSIWWIVTWRLEGDDEDTLTIVPASSEMEAVDEVRTEAFINKGYDPEDETTEWNVEFYVNYVVRTEGPKPEISRAP